MKPSIPLQATIRPSKPLARVTWSLGAYVEVGTYRTSLAHWRWPQVKGPSFLQCVAELRCSQIETSMLKLRCSKLWLSTKEGVMLTDLFLNSLANKLPRRKEELVCVDWVRMKLVTRNLFAFTGLAWLVLFAFTKATGFPLEVALEKVGL